MESSGMKQLQPTSASTRKIEPANRGLKALLAALCILVLAGTLSAGLWPFTFHPQNQAWWKPEKAGLYFGDHGMAISREKFPGIPDDSTKGFSIELWIEPALERDSSTLLSFFNPQTLTHFQLRQSGDDFAFTRIWEPVSNKKNQRNVYVDHALQKDRAVLVTLTSSDGTLRVYLDGVRRVLSSKNVGLRGADFEGTLIVANSPYDNASFDGIVHGLAIFDHALNPEEVTQDYQTWLKDKEAMARRSRRPFSLYLFNENRGTVLHNLGTSGSDLEIPKYYFLFQPGFLVPFWREYRANWKFAEDIAINIFGLVPLGFCFSALFAWLIAGKRSVWYTTILGLCVSLTIEVLQRFMPTRNSGTMDLITNTSGTALGAWLYLNAYSQWWLRRLRLVRTS